VNIISPTFIIKDSYYVVSGALDLLSRLDWT